MSEIETKTKVYTEAQKKANLKYRVNNQEKIREQRKKYYLNRKLTDPNFLIYKREKAKEYYIRKQGKKVIEVESKPILEVEVIEVKHEVIPEPIPEPILEPVPKTPIDTPIVKKRKYNKKI